MGTIGSLHSDLWQCSLGFNRLSNPRGAALVVMGSFSEKHYLWLGRCYAKLDTSTLIWRVIAALRILQILVHSCHRFVINFLMDFMIEERTRRLSEWKRELQMVPYGWRRMHIRRSIVSCGVESRKWRRRPFSCLQGTGTNLLNWQSFSFSDLCWMPGSYSIYDVRWIRLLFHDIWNRDLRNLSTDLTYKSSAKQ